MGSVDKVELGLDGCGVGSIVWVRRRNGSWWPGKILGPAELLPGHHVSTKSGTPVKLLGREDASVDWYNLGKSKRVKPFRCGEFDKCIERANAAVGMPLKKREKYARREDAIIHALELEKQLLDDKFGILGFKTHVFFTEDEDSDDPISPQEVNRISQIGEDMDTSNLLPRMNGLQDLGLKRYQSKRKLSSSASINGFHKLEPDDIDCLSDEFVAISGTRSSLVKKKKTPNDVLLNESLVKGHDRHQVQVLQRSENLTSKSTLRLSEEEHVQPTSKPNDSSIDDKVTSPVQMAKSTSDTKVDDFSCPTPLNEESASESTESTDTDSSKTLSMDSDEDDEMVSRAAFVPELESKSVEPSGQLRHRSTNSNLPSKDDISNHYAPASLGVSKWQIKGKRNNRSSTRRSTGATERWVARGSMYTADPEEVKSDAFGTDLLKRNFSTRRHPYYNQRYTPTSKASFKGDDDVSHSLFDWEHLTWNNQPLMSGYREDPNYHIDPTHGRHLFGERMKPGFVHVDLNVRSRYQREHVPMISLMSKFNGKAIVGHPIQVETLENGSTDSLLTGGGNFNHKSNGGKNGLSRKKNPETTPKNTSLSSNQKIKNLSAIGKVTRFGNDFRGENKNSFGGGLIKAEVGPTTVACIPLKLIFWRLNEGLAAVNKT